MTSSRFLVTREIGIDAGHRIPDHGSKCKNFHGHRYTIQATCEGPLFEKGEQNGMVFDFGFLKEEMMKYIDIPADHGMILCVNDPLLESVRPYLGKLLVLPYSPTAENLARYWFYLLTMPISRRTSGLARLIRLRVYETPNCWADYGE